MGLEILEAIKQFFREIAETFKTYKDFVESPISKFETAIDNFYSKKTIVTFFIWFFHGLLLYMAFILTFLLHAVVCIPALYRFSLALYQIIKRHTDSVSGGIVLTYAKYQMYYIYCMNLWRVLHTYQEDLKLRITGYWYSLIPSNSFVLKGNCWLWCYRAQKRNTEPFDKAHLEFIAEVINAEIDMMLRNGIFEGVVYPNNYRFIVDDVIDCGGFILIYVLFIADENDVKYIYGKNAINHDTITNSTADKGDDDFGDRQQ
jgi:hypothetical protein